MSHFSPGAVRGKTAELAIVAEREADYPGNKAKFTLTELNDVTDLAADPTLPEVGISIPGRCNHGQVSRTCF